MTSSTDNNEILPLHHNGQCITFLEWVSLLTLCLAPLIAHVASGSPQVSYLSQNQPKWYDELCHYNPTSILWRYAAITDRRIRAIRWSRESLAASNAILWTGKGWDGGEDMIITAAPYSLRYPGSTHVQLFSVAVLKTIITSLQGVSAAYSLIGRLAGTPIPDNSSFLGVDKIFYPLAILGLLRLFPAIWLTEDFTYAPVNENVSKLFPSGFLSQTMLELNASHDSLDPFLITLPPHLDIRFKSPRSSWPSMVFRTLYVLILGGLLAISLVTVLPRRFSTPGPWVYTSTSFLTGLFYSILLTISTALYTYYFLRGQTTTTLLPCISKTWYKIYTQLVIGCMIVLIVIASVETTRAPNGIYTSYPFVDVLKCTSNPYWWTFSPSSDFVGIASTVKWNQTMQNYSSAPVAKLSTHNASLEEIYWLYNLTGYCVGKLNDMTKV